MSEVPLYREPTCPDIWAPRKIHGPSGYRGTLLIRKRLPLGPYGRPIYVAL